VRVVAGRIERVAHVADELKAGELVDEGKTLAATFVVLRERAAGRAAMTEFAAAEEFDPEMFTPADHAALAGEWSWLGRVAGQAIAGGPAGLIDDELANVGPWGFDPARVAVPVLLLHGEQDRMVPSSHGRWLARACPSAELRLFPEDGHISVLRAAPDALKWLGAAHRGS